MRKRRRLIVVGIVLVSYALLMTFGGCADRMILFPSTHPVDADGAVPRTFTYDGAQIEIFTARSPGAVRSGEPAAYLLEFTGNATRAEDITSYVAHRWGDRPIEAWVMNYPGYGASTGPAQLKRIPPAALAAYDELKRVAGDKPILLAGNSLGTTAALYVAANRPHAGLLLQNPPPLRSLILRKFGWWNLWLAAGPIALQVPKELDSLANARKVNTPAVFILARSDQLVTPEFQRMVVDAYAGEKRLIAINGGHNDPIDLPGTTELEKAMDWILKPD